MKSSGLAYLGPRDLQLEDQLLDYLVDGDFPVVSLDVETVSIKDRRLIGVGIGLNQQESVYFRVMPSPTSYLGLCWQLLTKAHKVVLHNGIFDLTVLLEYFNRFYEQTPQGGGGGHTVYNQPGKYGVPDIVASITGRLADTSLMGQMQGLPTLELANMSNTYLGMDIQRISDLLSKGMNMLDLYWYDSAHKCLYDCLTTYRLYYQMDGPRWDGNESFTWTHEPSWELGFNPSEPTTHWVSEGMLDCYQVGIKLIPLLLKMTARGLALNHAMVEKWYERISQELLTYADICSKEGFNPASPQQVGHTLAARGNFLPFNKRKRNPTTGEWSKQSLNTSEETLEELADPLARVVLEHRGRNKLRGTYLTPYRWADRAYTHYRMDLSTARLASYDRNLMNVPDYIREILAPDTGNWSWMDFSQVEMRIAAEISQDPTMLAAYARGEDAHSETQKVLWSGTDLEDETIRLRSKTFNFAMLFWAKEHTLSKHTGLPTSVCREYKGTWRETYPGIYEWQLETIAEGWQHGWVETMYGRRCRVPSRDIATDDHIEKCMVNYPIQGTGFDVLARALLVCDSLGMDLALPVHDEILVDGIVDFPEKLTDLGKLPTPFKVHSGPHWR